MINIQLVPIALEHAAGLHACIDAVARERRYLAQTFAKPRADFDTFVRNVYKVLLTRGMRGVAIYSTDPQTYDHLRQLAT